MRAWTNETVNALGTDKLYEPVVVTETGSNASDECLKLSTVSAHWSASWMFTAGFRWRLYVAVPTIADIVLLTSLTSVLISIVA